MSKNKYIILSALTVLCLATAGLILLHARNDNGAIKLTEKQKSAVHAQDNTKKAQTVDAASPGKGDNTGTYTPPANSNGITVVAMQSNSQVIVTTKLVGYSDGTCNLSITNGAKTFSQSATVIYQPQYSTCAGFTVPVEQLGTGGWTINLTVTSGGITTTKSAAFEAK